MLKKTAIALITAGMIAAGNGANVLLIGAEDGSKTSKNALEFDGEPP